MDWDNFPDKLSKGPLIFNSAISNYVTAIPSVSNVVCCGFKAKLCHHRCTLLMPDEVMLVCTFTCILKDDVENIENCLYHLVKFCFYPKWPVGLDVVKI